MSDLSTYAGQAEHYAAVRARLRAMPLAIPQSSVSEKVSVRVAPVKQDPPPPPHGAPINLLTSANARNIVRLVSLRSGISVEDIVGPRRTRTIAAARHAAIGLIHTHCPHLSLPAIGRLFGDRDHTTILHSLGRKARIVPRTPIWGKGGWH